MIDTKELRRLAQAVIEWSNCNQAWLDQSEDAPAAVVGHIDEDGTTYPVATIDCDQYYAASQSLPLAKFYAAASPAAISELLERLEAAEKERDELRAKTEAMERQEPVEWQSRTRPVWNDGMWTQWSKCSEGYAKDIMKASLVNDWIYEARPLYALPGAQPTPSVPELLESLRCACNYIDKLGGVSQQYRAVLAAPETKP